MSAGRAAIADKSAQLLETMRAARPLVHNIANYVSMDVAANALLAIGASPAMVHAREEVAEFVAISGALVVNIGTLSMPWVEAMMLAADAARRHGKPWVLDPVGAGATQLRTETVRALLPHGPTIIRGNASEIMTVAGGAGVAPKGVDSANTTEEALAFASSLAKHQGCIVIATGAIDIITDGRRVTRLANGSPIMAKVTALGCALSSVTGAFAAVGADPFEASVAAVAVFGIAGEIAAERAKGPGSYRVAFLDELEAIGGKDIMSRLKIVD
ncbi:MAG: hydroxyethylthiazole kinase [Xanthobacteraceae bacterium]|nr:hydroxyethylthiazole kinase [Xanthobacteraceae bacterium]